MNYIQYIKDNTLRCEAGYRGGGIEINLVELLPELENPLMSAYQNYLGGGMLGRVVSNTNFDYSKLPAKQVKIVEEMGEQLKVYYHDITNAPEDAWEHQEYIKNQAMPKIDNIELSEDELLLAESMWLEDFINYEEEENKNE